MTGREVAATAAALTVRACCLALFLGRHVLSKTVERLICQGGSHGRR